MTYEIQGLAYDTRESALTALVAEFVDAGGLNTLAQVKEAVNEPEETAEELVKAWGGGEHEMGFPLADDLIHMGTGEDPASIDELAHHIKTRRGDIIIASNPSDTDNTED